MNPKYLEQKTPSFCGHMRTYLNSCIPQTFVTKCLLDSLVKVSHTHTQCKQAKWRGQKSSDVFRSQCSKENICAPSNFVQPVSFAQISHCGTFELITKQGLTSYFLK